MAAGKMSASKELMQMDLYGLLGIDAEASQKEIKKAYRQKALTCHPDKNPDNPRAAELFHQLSQALEVLTDGAARAAYDKLRKAKEAAAKRTQKLDAKRKKVKLDLEAREKEAQSHVTEEEEALVARTLEQQDTEEAVSTPPTEEDTMALVQEDEAVEPPSSSVRRRLTFSGRKRKAPTSATAELIEIAKKVLMAEKEQPKITGFAYYANEKLPTLDPVQRIHAERLMFEVLTQASFGNLDNSYVVMPRPQYPDYSWRHNPVPNPIGINLPNQNVVAPPYFYTPPRQLGNGIDPCYQQL